MLESLTGATVGVWSEGPSQTPAAPTIKGKQGQFQVCSLKQAAWSVSGRAQLWEKCPGGKRAPQPKCMEDGAPGRVVNYRPIRKHCIHEIALQRWARMYKKLLTVIAPGRNSRRRVEKRDFLFLWYLLFSLNVSLVHP